MKILKSIFKLGISIIANIAIMRLIGKVVESPYKSISILSDVLRGSEFMIISYIALVAIAYQCLTFIEDKIHIMISPKYKLKQPLKNYKYIKYLLVLAGIIIFMQIRSFNILTPNKIYHSSIATLFLTREYDYSEVNKIVFEKGNSKSYNYLEFKISFGWYKFDLHDGGSTKNERALKVERYVYNQIKNKSKNVKIINRVKPDSVVYDNYEYIVNSDIDDSKVPSRR
ncbi:hypothetical protein Ccar_24760 [Clostridium carboxidivorans P7]|nr:hypothetical protein [Clostridium carboxidivorans]AKN33867.1 hypothetical protein Ccar_24760 [Clostridium carboxidivorans P7]EFG86518.1 hypothetical protein CLCAR_3464 [Clostridium carboxidivorans P7]